MARALPLLHLSEERYHLKIGRIEYKVQPGKDHDGKPLYEFREYKFNLDEEHIFKRLFGHRLYGRTDVALRELFQNAIDATRVRVALEVSKDPQWNELSAKEQHRVFQQRYEQRKSALHLTVRLYAAEDGLTNKKRVWLEVRDQGVGMARDVIENYLLKVGRSRWREDSRVNRLPIGTVGEFGVGFLSTFMISDRTVIETQSCLPNEEGIRVTIYSWKGYLATQPLDLPFPGTSVRMLLKEDEKVLSTDLRAAILYWCPFLELPIHVTDLDGRTIVIAPRHPGRMPERDDALCIRLHGSQSLALLERVTRVRTGEVPPSVCQDGIVVPEIPPPILEEPAQQILRWRGIRIDLRGTDRVPLDLSRNLAEERADALWKRTTKLIWGGIATNGLFFAEGRSAFVEFVNSEFIVSKGRRLTTVGPNKRFALTDVSLISALDYVQFVQVDESTLRSADLTQIRLMVKSRKFASIILPDVDFVNRQEELFYADVEDPDAESYLGVGWELDDDDWDDWKETGKQGPRFLKVEKPSKNDEDDIELYKMLRKSEAIPATSPYRDDAVLSYWAKALYREDYASIRVSRYIARLFDTSTHACVSESGFSGLSRHEGLPVEKLAALWLSDSWLALRHPVKGVWCMLNTVEVEIALPAKLKLRSIFTFEQYVVNGIKTAITLSGITP